ncbi:MAG TPA: AsmA-like C-terminal region-containing protein [Isosphaeraceae bacterium]|jgi:hypothetical protein|nr:AsmA-like C-terminal region-containing protein [Isosphaeraceae bacterium]
MKCPRFRRRLVLKLALTPCLLWAFVLLVAPTDWARARLERRLANASGQPVRLAAVRLGVLGNLRLLGLEIGGDGTAPPWLRVDELRLDLNPVHLLTGCSAPKEVDARGVELTVHRDKDGNCALLDLLNGPGRGPSDPGGTSQPVAVSLAVMGGRVRVLDDPSGTALELRELDGRATWDGKRGTIESLKGKLNGGTLAFSGSIDCGGNVPWFEGRLQAQGVGLGAGMGALDRVVPVLDGTPAELDGTLDLDLDLRGEGTSRADLERSLAGQGAIALDPVALDGSRLVAELAKVVPLPPRGRIGSIRSHFTVGEGRVASDDLTVSVARFPIVLSGWADFGGAIDYRVGAEGIARKLPEELRAALADVPGALDELATLRLTGTPSAPVITLDGAPVNGPGDHSAARAKLRSLSRRLLDKIQR